MDVGTGGFRAVNADPVAVVVFVGQDPVDGLDGLSVHFLVPAVNGTGLGAGADSELDFLSLRVGESDSLLVASRDHQGGSCEERADHSCFHKAVTPIDG